MKFAVVKSIFPSWRNIALAIIGAILLILAFPDFEFWYLAWFALVPLMWAVEREKQSTAKSFVVGWIFGTLFFLGTCWWLTFAPITYAGFPPILAFFLLFCVTAVSGLFPAIFAALLSILLRRFGSTALLTAPFIWALTEFLRYWLTGNNWNAIGYSQAFRAEMLPLASVGSVYLVGFIVVAFGAFVLWSNLLLIRATNKRPIYIAAACFWISLAVLTSLYTGGDVPAELPKTAASAVIAIQPNVPMSGVDYQRWHQLRQRQIEMAEAEIRKISEQRIANNEKRIANDEPPITVIFPESPMNFMYEDDREFQKFINEFARRNNVSVLFNSAEPDKSNGKYFNSAVLVSPQGSEAAQYDKIYLLPFGEAVPWFLEGILPGFVGNFSYGREYDLLPLGDARAGVMICFESHFGQLSREYVRNGADVIIEMTNDGYLGPTPILRQHLANAVFRAVETNRPVLRVTNVGITAYINERGQVLDSAPGYTEATRIWYLSKSDGTQTFYVRFGDWFAWLCSVVTLGLMIMAIRNRKAEARV